MSIPQLSRRQVWIAEPDPIVGAEQDETRPVVIVSNDKYNQNAKGLLIAIPMTTADWHLPYHIPVQAGEGQLDKPSFIMCDQIKCISYHRLKKPLGYISNQIMSDIENMIKRLLDIDLP